jgi:hypothetical protein
MAQYFIPKPDKIFIVARSRRPRMSQIARVPRSMPEVLSCQASGDAGVFDLKHCFLQPSDIWRELLRFE